MEQSEERSDLSVPPSIRCSYEYSPTIQQTHLVIEVEDSTNLPPLWEALILKIAGMQPKEDLTLSEDHKDLFAKFLNDMPSPQNDRPIVAKPILDQRGVVIKLLSSENNKDKSEKKCKVQPQPVTKNIYKFYIGSAINYGKDGKAIALKGTEINLGLSPTALKILDKMNATDLVPQLLQILVGTFNKEGKLNSEILKNSLDKAAEMADITKDKDFNQVKEQLQADLISHEKEIADFISNKFRSFTDEADPKAPAITVEKTIQHLGNYLLAYIRRTEDQDLYTPLEGYYDTFSSSPQRFKLLEEVIIPFLQNPEQGTLLILGEAGSGKTMFAEYLTQYLWQSDFAIRPSASIEDNNPRQIGMEGSLIPTQPIIPVYIRLSNPDIKNLKERLIEDALISYGLTEEEVQLLLNNKNYPFCFIFDGTDELIRKDTNFETFYLTNKIHQRFPTSHCLFTGRISGFLGSNYEELFEPVDDHGKPLMARRATTIMLASFNEESKKEYIGKFIKERSIAVLLGYTDSETVYQRIGSISHLNEIVGRPILLMMTMNVLPYLEAFYKQEKELYSFEVVQKDLFHVYTHDLYRRAADKIKDRNNGLTHIGRNSVYDCILKYSIALAQAMNAPKNNSPIMEISEDEIFGDEDAFVPDSTPNSPQTARRLAGLKRFFCREYNSTVFKKEEDYKAFKFGREGCELLRYRGIPGHFIYSFIHNDFLDYLAVLTPQSIGGRRQKIKAFMDSYQITSENCEKQETVGERIPQNFGTSKNFFQSKELSREKEQEAPSQKKSSFIIQVGKLLLRADLPGESEPIYFREEEVLGDGNCGFTTLGASREQVAETLLTLISDPIVRESLSEEIKEALMTEQITTEASTRLLKTLAEQQSEEDRKLRELRNRFKELPEYANDAISKTIDWLNENGAPGSAEELRQISLQTFQAEDAVTLYYKSAEAFRAYVNELERNQNLWLGYKSALLYAKSKSITLYILTKSQTDPRQLILQEHVRGESAQIIYMLSTGRYTHFNLLVKETRFENDRKFSL